VAPFVVRVARSIADIVEAIDLEAHSPADRPASADRIVIALAPDAQPLAFNDVAGRSARVRHVQRLRRSSVALHLHA
jgi:ActR/RegA family two-component response regulator